MAARICGTSQPAPANLARRISCWANTSRRSEGEPAYPGVQLVRADHNVEPPHGTAGERHLDAVPVLGQPGNPVAEQVLGSMAGGVVQDTGQVAAHDLNL